VIFRQLNRIEQKLDLLLAREKAHMATLQDEIATLTTNVAAQDTVIGSVETLLTGLTNTINTLKGSIADPAAIAALDQLATQVAANSTRIAAAVTANTPST
jgi:hypothetical protein